MTSHQQQPTPDLKNDRVWDALNEIYRNCVAYSLVPQVLQPYIDNAELTTKIGNLDELLNLVRLLARDVQEFADRLRAIHAQHSHRSGSSGDGNDLMQVFQIQEQYVAWGTSYESVILPTLSAIASMYAAIGADTKPLEIESPMSVIEPSAAVQAEALQE
jgi:hypothetical protein